MTAEFKHNYKAHQWLSMLLFFIGFVLFFVAYVGSSWYVVPPPTFKYPPDVAYDSVNLGLFWMCVLGHCKYDLRVDYMVVAYIPFKDIQDAFQNYRTVCMAIITVAMCFCLIALALNLMFLSGFSFSHFVGFAAGACEITAGVITIIGVIIFGSKFRGSTPQNPFGWSLWLMVAAIIILILDGIITVIIASTITHISRFKMSTSASGRPLITN